MIIYWSGVIKILTCYHFLSLYFSFDLCVNLNVNCHTKYYFNTKICYFQRNLFTKQINSQRTSIIPARAFYLCLNQRSSSSIPISLAFPVSWVISFSNHIADITITSSSVMMTFPDPRGPDGILPSGPNLSEYPYSLS